MFKKILVPLDGSRLAESALPHALVLAQAFDSEVLVVHVLTTPEGNFELFPETVEWGFRQAEAAAHMRLVTRLFRTQGVTLKTKVVEGYAADQIVAIAQSWPADLVVMTKHGAGGLTSFPSGSTTSKVLERVGKSVLLIPSVEQEGTTHFRDDLYRRVVMPLDGSGRAEASLLIGRALARHNDSELVLAHVVPVPEMPSHNLPLDPEDVGLRSRVIARNSRFAERYLENLERSLALDEVRVRTRLDRSARVGHALAQLVREEDADLVILTAHGTGFGDERPRELETQHGSVSSQMLAQCNVATLLYQDAERGMRAPVNLEGAARQPLSRGMSQQV
jgi:nucleotide-binding universal stress UspA family protein